MIRKGTYVLFLHFEKDVSVNVGSLGEIHLDPGNYCYVGSAMGGLDQRVNRHFSKDKSMRWHIDRLTMIADDMHAYESFPDYVEECSLAHLIENTGCSPAVDGFGCSDCMCQTHLFKVADGLEGRLVDRARLHIFKQSASS